MIEGSIVAGAYGYNINIPVGISLLGVTEAKLRVQLNNTIWELDATVWDIDGTLRVVPEEGDFPSHLTGIAWFQVMIQFGPTRRMKSQKIEVPIQASIPAVEAA